MNGGLKHFLKVLELLLCGWMKEKMVKQPVPSDIGKHVLTVCLLYTSDAADEDSSV